MPETLYLVDAMGLVFRAHFAFLRRPLTTSTGMPVGALYGFLSTLLALIRDERARRLAVALDTPSPTFRHERYAEYKANRPELPAELVPQLPYVSKLIEALGLRAVVQDGVEADDWIASLAKQARARDWEVVIVSADKDFAQLIGPGIRQYVPGRGGEAPRWIDAEEVEEKWGVTPAQFTDFLALTGDSSDNVPGVAGIGPKTAARLLQAHGTLEAIYAALPGITPPGVRGKLEAGRENALLSRELVVLRTDLGPVDLSSLEVPGPGGRETLRVLLAELEFRNLLERLFPGGTAIQGSLLEGETPPPGDADGARRGRQTTSRRGGLATEAGRVRSASDTRQGAEDTGIADGWNQAYRLITDPRDLARVVARCREGQGPLGVDTETTGLDQRRAGLVGISLCRRAGEAWYLPVGHRAGGNLELGALQEVIGPLLAEPGIEKVAQNFCFDLQILERHGLRVGGRLIDTMIASYVCDPEKRHNLDDLSRHWLGHEKVPISALIGSGRQQCSMADLPAARVMPYACEDADAVVRLWPRLAEALRARGGWPLYRDVEMPLVPVLIAMETAGIALDCSVLAAMETSLGGEMQRREAEIHRLAGETFNVNSPKQLQAVLFEKLKLAPRRKTKTGYSTSQAVLQEMAGGHPLPQAVLAYRQLAKLKNTYVEALPRMVDERTGRIHARFHQTITATGRLSSSDPNLQNIPVRSALGREIRRAFVAGNGMRFLSADYSQIELRILAHLSGDEHLVAAFREGADIHRATGARVFGVAAEAVTPEMRVRAKTVNFGVIYGMGAQRLASELGIPVKEAAGFIEDYFAKLPRMKVYIEGCIAAARAAGYAETLLGRRRYLPDLDSGHPRDRAAAERMALNTTIQGSAADLIKVAMVRLHEVISREHPRARLLLQVHDELLFEVPADELESVGKSVRSEMEAVLDLAVPLRVEMGAGKNWLEAHC
ncbi:MAG: DNA polymerase I [Candidatus Eisenbacteria sp.]|nr:DNA polymerase I [Candidatus Eisenbacteria bacterium]